MYCGMAFDINDRERFSEYKDQFSDFLEEMNEDVNLINNATVIEYEDNLYLFVDGHDSILNCPPTTLSIPVLWAVPEH